MIWRYPNFRKPPNRLKHQSFRERQLLEEADVFAVRRLLVCRVFHVLQTVACHPDSTSKCTEISHISIPLRWVRTIISTYFLQELWTHLSQCSHIVHDASGQAHIIYILDIIGQHATSRWQNYTPLLMTWWALDTLEAYLNSMWSMIHYDPTVLSGHWYTLWLSCWTLGNARMDLVKIADPRILLMKINIHIKVHWVL
jgi:hypothetical protein